MTGTKKWGNTTSKRGELSRIFVANVCPRATFCEDLERVFEKYGKIQGIDIKSNGFAFIQFETADDAQKAVDGEKETTVHGKILEVKMFDKSNSNRGRPPRGDRERSRSPMGGRDQRFGHPRGGGGRGRFSSPGPIFEGGSHIPPFANGPQQMNFPGHPMPPMGNSMARPNGPAENRHPNELEIIVINRDQWGYADLVERRIRTETSLKLVDVLFLHSVQHIALTLNDLYERRTLYAVVIAPMNEQNKTCTLHILHNQTEHRNLPLTNSIGMIQRDYCNIMGIKDPTTINYQPNLDNPNLAIGGNTATRLYSSVGQQSPRPVSNPANEFAAFGLTSFGPGSSQTQNANQSAAFAQQPGTSQNAGQQGASTSNLKLNDSGKLPMPDEVRYALRMTIEDNTAQFLSPGQIDLVINYYQNERARLTGQSKGAEGVGDQRSVNSLAAQQQPQFRNESDKGALFENPQIKAALNSLMQIGAINPSNLPKAMENIPSSGNPAINGQLNGFVSQPTQQIPFGYDRTQNQLQQTMLAGPSSSFQQAYQEAPSYLSTEEMSHTGVNVSSELYNSGGAARRVDSPLDRAYRPLRSNRLH